MLRIVEPGLLSTVQDAGRTGHLRSAVPPAGPADPIAFEAAQRLVGNDAAAAGIETVGRLRFALDEPRLVAATGRGVRVRARGEIGGWTAVFVRAGEEVEVEGTGRFAYVAVSGGLALDRVLGARATYLPAAIGPIPRPLAAGDALPLGPARWGADHAGRALSRSDDGEVLVTRGPHAERFAEAEAFLHGGTYRVSERSDRQGVRLEGSPLASDGREVLSFGVLPGAVQVPHGGEPIVLLADHQTTGGYAVVATVIRAALGAVAQALPGEQLTFREVERDAAVAAYRAVRRWLDAVA